MFRALAIVFAGILLAAGMPCAAQAPRIEVLETDPPRDTELAPREPLYVRVRFAASVPFRLQARGYRSGVEQQASMMNPSPVYAAGQGEAIAWIAFDSGLVDEVRVLAFDERWQPMADARVSRSVLWSRTAPHVERRTPWVDSLNAYQQSTVSQHARAATPPATAGDLVLFQLVALSVPGYLALQAFVLWRRRGRAKRAELVPLFVMVPAFAHALFALAADSNLWPIFLLFLSPVAFAYLLVLLVVRRAPASAR